MSPVLGQAAPAFTLKDQSGQERTLASLHANGPVLLVFYPFAFSRICTGEMCALRDDGLLGHGEGVQVAGVSCDPMWSLRAWAESERLPFPLLSDFWPHGAVAQAYGVFVPETGFATRGSFLIDQSGLLRWSTVNAPGEARSTEDYRTALAALG